MRHRQTPAVEITRKSQRRLHRNRSTRSSRQPRPFLEHARLNRARLSVNNRSRRTQHGHRRIRLRRGSSKPRFFALYLRCASRFAAVQTGHRHPRRYPSRSCTVTAAIQRPSNPIILADGAIDAQGAAHGTACIALSGAVSASQHRLHPEYSPLNSKRLFMSIHFGVGASSASLWISMAARLHTHTTSVRLRSVGFNPLPEPGPPHIRRHDDRHAAHRRDAARSRDGDAPAPSDIAVCVVAAAAAGCAAVHIMRDLVALLCGV